MDKAWRLSVQRVLVLGIGNPMRGDDAAGCHAAHTLEQLYRGDPQVEVMAVHQLTPELADDVSQSGFVLFLDAATGEPPGTIRWKMVSPASGPRAFSHHLTPWSLLAAAQSLYGDAPAACSLSIAGASFELGKRLSTLVADRMPELLRRARGIIDAHHTTLRPAGLAHTR
jgi:hydrogenase maturation protease